MSITLLLPDNDGVVLLDKKKSLIQNWYDHHISKNPTLNKTSLSYTLYCYRIAGSKESETGNTPFIFSEKELTIPLENLHINTKTLIAVRNLRG
jgi:hypothetical protein